MDHRCKNCQHLYTGQYCNVCGQAADTHKINLHYMWHDIQHGLFHVDKGILYSFKELYTRPGHTIREFIDGKRVKHFKPLSLVIVLATMYGFMYHYFNISVIPEVDFSENPEEKSVIEKLNLWLSMHLSLTHVVLIPVYALFSYLFFRKQGYNYAEHLILNAYSIGQRLFFMIASFPITYYLSSTHHLKLFIRIQFFIEMALMIWVYMQFFNKLSKWRSFFTSLLCTMVFFSFLLLLIIIILLMLNPQ